MASGSARGLALGVVDPTGPVWEFFPGWRDVESKLPIDGDTIFGLASVTKSFTALSVLALDGEGVLSIDDPLRDYIPEFTNRSRPDVVRLRHLLCHSGGFFPLPRTLASDVARDMGIEDSIENGIERREDLAVEGTRRVAEQLDAQSRFTGQAGQRLSYCNDGFGLLSDVVRRKTSRPFVDFVDEKILSPLGMTRTNGSFVRNAVDPDVSTLYTDEKGEHRADHNFVYQAFVLPGGGGLKSTLHDMERYVMMFLNEGRAPDGSRVVRRSTLERMERPRQLMCHGVWYGYGLQVRPEGGVTFYGHGGSLPGVSSYFCYCRELGLGVVVLCNTLGVEVSALALGVMRLLGDLPSPERTFRPRTWSADEVAQLPGSYVSGEGDVLKVTAPSAETLAMTLNGKPVGLEPVFPWEGRVRSPWSDVWFSAVRDDDGRVFAARWGSRILPKS